jgi:NAD(P)-dependent dehydrogenase (short-subunit alcohol dehydrogenase family)
MSLTIDLTDRVAIVTGTTSGIGAGVAKVLAEAGCDVLGCGRRPAESREAHAFVQGVEAFGRRAVYVQADLCRPEDIERLAATAGDAFDQVDVLVSNAGLNVFGGADDCDLDRWSFNERLNLRAHWLMAKCMRPLLDAARAPVVEIMSSNHAYSTMPGCFPYNVTKAALTGLVQALAVEWGPRIRVVGVAPGYIETEASQPWFDRFPDPHGVRRRWRAITPASSQAAPY